MDNYLESALTKTQRIQDSGLNIYDLIEEGDKRLWLTNPELEKLLDYKLIGISLRGLPLRSRSKKVKSDVCASLGYPIPKSFKKTQPRFPGQKFDTYIQKSNNLQIWNEDLDLNRRYVLIKLNEVDVVSKIRVVLGRTLAPLDKTGTQTQKYQARLQEPEKIYELISYTDTANIIGLCGNQEHIDLSSHSSNDDPINGKLLPISAVYKKLKLLVGVKFSNPGIDQERNRGAALHQLVCEALGFSICKDSGQFPDIRNQLLEVKLQTSPTIDLGLVPPDSTNPLDIYHLNFIPIRHCDVRYAIFYGKIEDGLVKITNLIVTNGIDFFDRFPRFEGKGLNKKIQIRLPQNFFDD